MTNQEVLDRNWGFTAPQFGHMTREITREDSVSARSQSVVSGSRQEWISGVQRVREDRGTDGSEAHGSRTYRRRRGGNAQG